MRTLEDLNEKYVIEDSGNPEKFHYVHMFLKRDDIFEDFSRNQIFSLKDGLDRIIQLKLGIYLVEGFHPDEDIEVVKSYLRERGYDFEDSGNL